MDPGVGGISDFSAWSFFFLFSENRQIPGLGRCGRAKACFTPFVDGFPASGPNYTNLDTTEWSGRAYAVNPHAGGDIGLLR